MARLAIILHDGAPGSREKFLGSILDFFGVPWKLASLYEAGRSSEDGSEYAVLGSVRCIAGFLQQHQANKLPEAAFAYVDDEKKLSLEAIRSLLGNSDVSLLQAPPSDLKIQVCADQKELTGTMSGLQFSMKLAEGDAILAGALSPDGINPVTIISAGGAPVFIRYQHVGGMVFLSASSRMIDIEQPVRTSFYDIKNHFCSVVPLVMFVKSVFAEVAWRPQELGACLIIDDPLLKPKYGFCDFANLRNLMLHYGFTTNIAFIPWNWRRTSPSARRFFDFDSGGFSVSVHGCDHTAGEFATTSRGALHRKAQLARSRMQNHELRTGIKCDRVMVFPQGAFSSVCPEVLKKHGFLAAVNTEITPLDSENSRTAIKDVWDLAIMNYGNFPIFTRRYAYHGLENFAFDLLLGKPCFIVSHHDFFKNDGGALIDLMEKISSLNCQLHWRSPEQVIRRACRRRVSGHGLVELDMYSNELMVSNASNSRSELRIRKKKGGDELVSEVRCGSEPIAWRDDHAYIIFETGIDAVSEKCFQIILPESTLSGTDHRSIQFEFAVAARRILSEIRDEYVSTNSYLRIPMNKFKGVVKRIV
jgi:hypothetical protein